MKINGNKIQTNINYKTFKSLLDKDMNTFCIEEKNVSLLIFKNDLERITTVYTEHVKTA